MFSSTPTRSLLLIPEHPSDFTWLISASEIISIIPTGYFNSTCESESVSQSVVSHSLRPHGLQPARLLSPWDSAGKNTGVGCHSIQVLYHLSHQGRSFLIMIPSMKFSWLSCILAFQVECQVAQAGFTPFLYISTYFWNMLIIEQLFF